jgi:hypothetical protein
LPPNKSIWNSLAVTPETLARIFAVAHHLQDWIGKRAASRSQQNMLEAKY